MLFDRRTTLRLAEMICGDLEDPEKYFLYRTGSELTDFFYDCQTDYEHDGSTRKYWVRGVLEDILAKQWPNLNTPPEEFSRVIRNLMDKNDATNESNERLNAIRILNESISGRSFEAFYADDGFCYLRHIPTNRVVVATQSPHRPFSAAELEKKNQLSRYLKDASEDELIQQVLLPLFRQLGFQRVSAVDHKDKALEYGKDIWMRYTLPTQHILYFGIQVKKGKLDSAGVSRASNANIAEMYNQVLMMLGHEIFDPEANRRVLVDHAYIVAGGEITKAAKNWLGNKLDADSRRQIIFMDREDILNLFVTSNLQVPVRTVLGGSRRDTGFDTPF